MTGQRPAERTNSGPRVNADRLRTYAGQVPVVLSVHNLREHLLEAADTIEFLQAEVERLRTVGVAVRDVLENKNMTEYGKLVALNAIVPWRDRITP